MPVNTKRETELATQEIDKKLGDIKTKADYFRKLAEDYAEDTDSAGKMDNLLESVEEIKPPGR